MSDDPPSEQTAIAAAVNGTLSAPPERPAWKVAIKLQLEAITNLVESNCTTMFDVVAEFEAFQKYFQDQAQRMVNEAMSRPRQLNPGAH
ncbi:MAG TPA: hypothetical protein VGM15_03145 [Burkholderiaceae bacterium]|jgi:hypothetical protein